MEKWETAPAMAEDVETGSVDVGVETAVKNSELLESAMLLSSVPICCSSGGGLSIVGTRGSFRLSSYPIDGLEELSQSTSAILLFAPSASLCFFLCCFHETTFSRTDLLLKADFIFLCFQETSF